MKKTLLLLALFTTFLSAQGQAQEANLDSEYPTIVSSYEEYYGREGNMEWIQMLSKVKEWLKHWEMYYHFENGEFTKTTYYVEMGDSVVSGRTYIPVTLSGNTLLYRQEDDKVYYLASNGEEWLILDYALNEGDIFVNPQGKRFTVTSVEYAEEYGHAYGDDMKYWRYKDFVSFMGISAPKVLHLRSEDSGEEDTWVEGFGSVCWGILPPYIAEGIPSFASIPVKAHVLEASDLFFMGCHFELNEDDYKRIYFDPENNEINYEDYIASGLEWDDYIAQFPWTFSFRGDTLCIQGIQTLNCLVTYAECSIKKGIIDITIGQYDSGLEQPDCMVERAINVRIPGFKSGVYEVGLAGQEHQTVVSSNYTPFVQEGKVWKVGNMDGTDNYARELRYYYFDGDTTLVEGQRAHRLMRRTETAESRTTEYVAGLYEQDRIVYCEYPEVGYAMPLYDFASEARDTTWLCSPYFNQTWQMFVCAISGKSYQKRDAFEGVVTAVDIIDVDDLDVKSEEGVFPYGGTTTSVLSEYIEGVGSCIAPLKNLEQMIGNNDHERLMSCIVGRDTLYNDTSLAEDISLYWDDDADVKKEKIDFTHVVKTKPTAPRRRVNSKDEGGEEAPCIWAEVSETMLGIGILHLGGTYGVTIRNADNNDTYAQQQTMDNLQRLDIRLAEYPEGEYTLTLENDEEAYVARFSLPFDGTSIRPVSGSTSAPVLYDLTGRRLSRQPQRGLYIRDGKKLIVQ